MGRLLFIVAFIFIVLTFAAAQLFPVALEAQDVILPGITFPTFDLGVQGQAAILATKALWVEILVEGAQPRGFRLALFGRDGFLAIGAFGGLFAVVVIRAVNVLFGVGDEGHIDHVAVADHAREALRVEGAALDAHRFALDLIVTARASISLIAPENGITHVSLTNLCIVWYGHE